MYLKKKKNWTKNLSLVDQVKTIIIIICVHYIYIYIYSIKNYKYSSGHEKKKKNYLCAIVDSNEKTNHKF